MTATATGMILDPTQRSSQAQQLEGALRARIVGQEEAIRAIVSVYQVFLAGLDLPSHPVGSLLFLGPTGSGKTRIVEATAEALFGDGRALIHVDCGEFQHSHEIAKLIGSPPGYLGHRETHPVLTQEALNQWHRENFKLSLVMFDEIEKASDSLWHLLLSILDKATLTLGDNRRVDFSQTLIFMTSNLGATEIANKLHGRIGFGMEMTVPDERLEQKLKKIPIEAARRKFSPEFMNRIDKVIAFRPLTPADLEQVLEIELERVRQRLLQASGGNQFEVLCSPEARMFLLQDGMDLRYGARHLRRSIERHLVDPLAHLLATHQVERGDFLAVDRSANNKHLTFIKSGRAGKLASWIVNKKSSLSFPKQDNTQRGKLRPQPETRVSSR